MCETLYVLLDDAEPAPEWNSKTIRGRVLDGLRTTAEMSLEDADHLWWRAARAWDENKPEESEAKFRAAAQVLVGLAGLLCNHAGYDMTVKPKG